MKKLIFKAKEWIVWLMSRRVGEAINSGASYEEVLQIVHEEVAKA